jgi:hypothetical protein
MASAAVATDFMRKNIGYSLISIFRKATKRTGLSP